MYATLLFLHSVFRWLVLAALVIAIVRGRRGWQQQRVFTGRDNAIRHWTATIAHVQLALGMTLYFTSPLVKYFLAHTRDALQCMEYAFFGLVHLLMMLTAVVLITIGSSMAKRRPSDSARFKTMTLWFAVALLIILLAIPWPFSPLAARPWLRTTL